MNDQVPEELEGIAHQLRRLGDMTGSPPGARRDALQAALAAHHRTIDKRKRRRRMLAYGTGSVALAASLLLLALSVVSHQSGSSPLATGQTHNPRYARLSPQERNLLGTNESGQTDASAPSRPANGIYYSGTSARAPRLSLAASLASVYQQSAPKVTELEVTMQVDQDNTSTAYVAQYPVERQDSMASMASGSVPQLSTLWRRLALRGPLGQAAKAVAGVPLWLQTDPQQLGLRPVGAHRVAVLFDSVQRDTRSVTIATVDRRTGLIQELDRTVTVDGHVVSHSIAHYRYQMRGAASGT